ncbi:hypothetical protein MOUN0_O05028 [Monosporozyma unispora]|nr:hypothetical protein C6P44_004079 [Kazachstania unispora]
MSDFNCLPDEVLCHCLKFCDNKNIRIIDRRFYYLRNEWFKHKVLTIFPLGHPIWDTILTPLIQYIKELDSIRNKARLLLYSSTNYNKRYHSMECMEYISDSWEIIYSILKRPLPLYNFENGVNSRYQIQRRDRHFQILSDNNVTLPKLTPTEVTNITQGRNKLPLNIWIYIEDIKYASYVSKIITEFSSYETNELEMFFFGCYLHEWIKEPGVYCIKLGDIPNRFITSTANGNLYTPIKISSYIGNEVNWNFENKLKILGYSFDNFSPYYQWIFFKLPLNGENCVLNKWGSIISTLIAQYYIKEHQPTTTSSSPPPSNETFSAPYVLSNEKVPIDYNTTFPLNFFYKTPITHWPHPNPISKDLRLPKLVNM